MTIDDIMRVSPVIPVVTIDDASSATLIAETLVAGGVSIAEVTLRTPTAFEAIERMANVPGMIVGAGSVLDTTNLRTARTAGAKFIVSPGLSESLVEFAIESQIPVLPGVATASDIMRGLGLGLNRFKFFPAETSGGVAALKALSAPFKQCRFCPTGGITYSSAARWLALDAVSCVGGSWIVPGGVLEPPAIYEQAKAVAQLSLTRKQSQ